MEHLYMDRSDFLEVLAALYLRLNGYLASGYIAHAPIKNLTEIDLIGVRFPQHCEPEREVLPCPRLHPPTDRADFIVGEVKGGKKRANFNPKFRERPDAIRKVLRRIGAFSEDDIDVLIPQIVAILKPERLRRLVDFPSLPVQAYNAQLSFVLFSPDQVRAPRSTRPVIFGDDILGFMWKCFRPSKPRSECAVDYNRELWGHQFNDLVAYFKDLNRERPRTVDEVYNYVMERHRTVAPADAWPAARASADAGH
jgi:hypothetical protein